MASKAKVEDRTWPANCLLILGVPNPWPAIRNARRMEARTLDRGAQIVYRWFLDCLTEHKLCGNPSQNLPTRVLDVGDEDQEPHLYETRKENAEYTALSHCWGDAEHIHLTTTRGTLEDRKRSIPLKALPKTFYDAVLLTRALGIRYLWIDSLCILQDDKDDWARESARMAQVYQNAALTISADGAANSSEGLFLPHATKEVPLRLRQSADSAPVYVRETTLASKVNVHAIGSTSDEPLRSRGWTLQEWLLSARVAHFTKGEMLWECGKTQQCECQLKFDLLGEREDATEWEGKGGYFKNGTLDWPTVVHEFSGRQLSQETDKLPALSGLAAFAKTGAERDYVAGLWRSELPEALLWTVEPDKGSEPTPCTEYHAPSWSWASIHGRVQLNLLASSDEPRLKCNVLDLVAPLATSNPFGALERSYIKVKGAVGKLTRAVITEERDFSVGIEGGGGGPGADWYGYLTMDVKASVAEVTSADEVPVLIIKREMWTSTARIYGIVLRKMVEVEETFTRAGHFKVTYEGDTSSSTWESWFRDTFDVSERTITIF